MKKILLWTIVPVVALMASKAEAATPHGTGPLTITWSVSHGAPQFEPAAETNTFIKKGTNDVGTNLIYTYKARFTNSILHDEALIALLAGSFSTNFDKGDTLAIDKDNIIYVVRGTNIIMDVSSVLSVAVTNAIFSDSGEFTYTTKETSTNSPPITTYSGAPHGTQMAYARVKYDDSTLITDGTATTFRFTGVVTTTISLGVTKTGVETFSESFTLLEGGGYGTILGVPSIITGSVTGGPVEGTDD